MAISQLAPPPRSDDSDSVMGPIGVQTSRRQDAASGVLTDIVKRVERSRRCRARHKESGIRVGEDRHRPVARANVRVTEIGHPLSCDLDGRRIPVDGPLSNSPNPTATHVGKRWPMAEATGDDEGFNPQVLTTAPMSRPSWTA
jgi:hypothetical protein